MKENKYDDEIFFEQYSKMYRSVEGLNGAGEWHVLRSIMPELKDKKLLDLGCGYGWHCKYAIEQGANRVMGIDLSERMIQRAKEINSSDSIEYMVASVEDFDYSKEKYDVVLSSLTFHYIESFEKICKNVHSCLVDRGEFIFSVEHPIFTSYGTQQWYRDDSGKAIHWPVDNYFFQGIRKSTFLGNDVMKYHKTLTNYISNLISCGFEITNLIEPEPTKDMLDSIEEMKEELRRPMMLIISAKKK